MSSIVPPEDVITEGHTSTPPPSTTKPAKEPFDKPTADIILRSSDGVDFRVFQVVLSLASPLFETMFTLNQPTNPKTGDPPVIDVSEDSETLDALLRFCYPVDNPNITRFTAAGRTLAAAIKYDISVAKKKLLQGLYQYRHIPRRVLELCCRLSLEDEACRAASWIWRSIANEDTDNDAAEFSRTEPGRLFDKSLESVSAGVYYRLLHHGARTTLYTETRIISPLPGSITLPEPSRKSLLASRETAPAGVDATLRSSDGVEFFVHRLILRLSGVENELTKHEIQPDVFATDIASDSLALLLEFCYPPGANTAPGDGSAPLDACSCRLYGNVIAIAKAFGMSMLMNSIRASWSRVTIMTPVPDYLGMYLIAARVGWLKEAKILASAVLQRPLRGVYSPELERTPAGVYHSLLKFRHDTLVAAFTVFRQHAAERGQGSEELTGWREGWFSEDDPHCSRRIPSVLVERHMRAASRSNFSDAPTMAIMATQARQIQSEIEEALKKVTLNIQGEQV